MDVRAEGPYEVGSLVFLSSEGTWAFTVIAKATFVLAPEESPVLAEGGDPVLVADVPWGEGPGWSLRACSDLVPFKQTPELLLSGSAYSPAGKPVRAAMARVAFGAVDKTIEVQGDRYFAPGGVLSDAAPWTRMPLVWERAAGGPETINPVGIPTGRAAITDARGRTYLPNLWPPWTSLSGPEEELPPVCFGPLSPDWPERMQRLHPGLAWELPLPPDFDGGYFNAAPEDQRLPEITGNETLVLEHLHPRHARLVTKLAPAAPMAVIETPGHAPVTIELDADTLWIDTDRGLATVTYRGHAAVHDPAMPGTFVVRARGEHRPSSTVAARARQVTLEVVMPSTPLPPAWERTGPTPHVEQAPLVAPTPHVAPTPQDEQTPLVGPPPTLAQALHAKIHQGPGMVLSLEKPQEPAFVPPPTETSEPVAPPPLWSGIEDPDKAPDTSRTPFVGDTPALPAIPAPPPGPEGPPPLPVEAYPLARCAALAASLDARPEETRKILEKASLDEDTWERLVEHWNAAIEKELRRQGNKLLREYDAAYVARLEEERGPVAASDYARLAAAAEVNEIDPVLSDLKIPAAAWPRLRRVWIQLVAKDRKLATLVQGFLEDERRR